MTLREPAWCPDCERSTGGACPKHPRVVGIEDAFWRAIREGQDEAVARARIEERGACAHICDELADAPMESATGARRMGAKTAALYLARMIRARGQK